MITSFDILNFDLSISVSYPLCLSITGFELGGGGGGAHGIEAPSEKIEYSERG